jgi:hypothetical protein
MHTLLLRAFMGNADPSEGFGRVSRMANVHDIGVDLLMNQRKRPGGSVADSMSVRSEPVDDEGVDLGDLDISMGDDEEGGGDEDLGTEDGKDSVISALPPQASGRRPSQFRGPLPSFFRTGDTSGPQAAGVAQPDVEDLKRDLLYKFDRLEKRGVPLPRRFGMHSNYQDMKREYERLERDRETDAAIQFQRKVLMALVTGVEFLNHKFDPFDVHLDGWSETVQGSLTDYDDVFEALHDKYRTKANIPPEVKFMMMLAGSGVMYHLSNTMFRNSMPDLQEVLRRNPSLMKQFAAATMDTMAQDQVPGAREFSAMHNLATSSAAPGTTPVRPAQAPQSPISQPPDLSSLFPPGTPYQAPTVTLHNEVFPSESNPLVVTVPPPPMPVVPFAAQESEATPMSVPVTAQAPALDVPDDDSLLGDLMGSSNGGGSAAPRRGAGGTRGRRRAALSL